MALLFLSETGSVGQVRNGQLRQVIESLTTDSEIVAVLDGSSHNIYPVAIGPSEGEALRDWVVAEGAIDTIEIGLGYGVSALYICEGLVSTTGSEQRHVVIDPYQQARFKDCGLQVLKEAGVADLVTHYGEESQLVLPRLLSEGRKFDLAFVDGNHRFDWVFVDLFFLGRLLRPGSVVFVDDYQLPGIARAIAFFLNNAGWTLELSHRVMNFIDGRFFGPARHQTIAHSRTSLTSDQESASNACWYRVADLSRLQDTGRPTLVS